MRVPDMSGALKACLLLLALLIGPSGGSARAAGFLEAIEDLPLMPGLEELVDRGLAFDKPGGRIVEAYAQGPVTARAVQGFYGDTLPQLGWQPLSAESFLREGEQLDVTVLTEAADGQGGGTLVRFTLRPR